MTDPITMASAINLRIGSPELDILVCTSPQDILNDHASISLSSPIHSSSPVRADPTKLPTRPSCERNAKTVLSQSDSTTKTRYEATHRQLARRRTRLSKDDTQQDHSKETSQKLQEYARTISKRRRPQTRQQKERFNPRLVHAEKVKGAELLELDHAEQVPSRYTKGETRRMRSPDTSDIDLPLMHGLRATRPHEISLPTPPDSEIGSDPNDCDNEVKSNRRADIPSYRFVLTPQSPSVNISSSSGVLQSTRLSNLYSTQTTPPAPGTHNPLLNLTWRDLGNGISRAYPKHRSPPVTLRDLVEGFDYFIGSDDEDTPTAQDPPKKHRSADKTIESKYGLFFDGRNLKTSSKPLSSREEPIEIFSSDSEVEIIVPKAVPLPSYTFVATPPSAPKQLNSTPEKDNRQITIDLNTEVHINHDSNDTIPSNVQPTHLTPRRIPSSPSPPPTSTEVEQYTPNTSSGFSDSDADTEPEIKLFPYFERYEPGATNRVSKMCRRERRDR